ncbi:hypothetical protein RHSIM_Rhsim03G0189400 [Rhododendron simsii]|uniref:Uncharacterized protein n=1 Tax=Rhododendron simsii TaxID=118357 RepID=A0A834LTD1_RHOSS|nr:hypothetical protein RHSIM_Rhsim03G0189400 [Rhododendron simsii]
MMGVKMLGIDEDGVLRVEYDDEMKGVEVAAATAEQIEIGDLVGEKSASKLKDLVPYNGIVNVEGLHRPLLAIQPGDATVFYVFANCRHRVDPPMPMNYFSNLIRPVVTKTSAGLLLENPAEFGAGMIKKAIKMHDAKAIEAWNIEWECKVLGWKDEEENCVVVGNSPQFKAYDVDFEWGKPEVVRSGSNNRFDGTVYMHQGKSGGRSVDLDIGLEANAMDNLEKDEEFLMGMA